MGPIKIQPILHGPTEIQPNQYGTHQNLSQYVRNQPKFKQICETQKNF